MSPEFPLISWFGLLYFFHVTGLPLSLPPPPEDKMLVAAAPEECLVYVSWYGSAAAKRDAENRVERLLAEPEVRTFLNAMRHHLDATVAELSGPAPDDVLALMNFVLSRPTSLFITRLDLRRADGPPDVAGGAIVNAGDSAAWMKELLLRMEKRWLAGPPIEIQEAEEVQIEGVRLRSVPVVPGIPPVEWGFYKTYLVVGLGEGSAKRIITSLKAARGPPSWLKSLHERLPVERPAVVQYFNLAGAAAAAREMPGLAGAIVGLGLDALGLNNVESLASVTGLGESDVDTKTLLAVKGKPRGVFDVLGEKPLHPAGLNHVPRDADWAVAARLDLAKAYETVFAIVDKLASGSDEEARRHVAAIEEFLGFRVHQDLLQPLGDVWTLHSAPSQGGFLFTGACATVTVRDRARLQKTYQRIVHLIRSASREAQLRQSVFRGQSIYHLEFKGVPFAPAWCLTDKRFVAALYPQVVKAHLAAEKRTRSLASRAEVAALFQQRPVALSFQNTPQVARKLYPFLKMVAPIVSRNLPDTKVAWDPSTLPSAKAIYPHLSSSTTTVARTDAGLLAVSRQTQPGSLLGLGSTPVVLALVLPALQKARELSRQRGSMGKLQQIALALHEYHDVHGHLPSPANYDKDGKPLLSWRVHLLPFLDQQDLYDKFRLDEPWDSPHNKKLMLEIPAVYQTTGWYFHDGRTAYAAPRGERTMFPPGKPDPRDPKRARGIPFASVTDGLTQTIMIVELGLDLDPFRDHSVIWTKPEDWDYDPKQVTARLGIRRVRGFLAARGDGSVFVVKREWKKETIRALFTRNGGERLELP